MGILGNLDTMSVIDLLQFLETGLKSGILKISREDVTKEIFFEKGIIVGSTSNDPKEYFGQFLLHYGKIDEPQLRLALEKQRQNKIPLGLILVSMGIFVETEMMELLRLRSLEILYDLFLWEQAEFQFQDNAPMPADLIRIEIKPTNVVMEGIYRVDEWRRYRERIRSDRVILGMVQGRSLTGVQPGSDVPKILWLVNKRMPVGEVCYNMHASPFHVYSELYRLLSEGVIQVLGELPPVPVPVTARASVLEASAERLQRAQDLLKKGSQLEAIQLLQEVLEAEPGYAEASALLASAESQFVRRVYATMFKADAIPRLAATLGDLTRSSLGPKEGFILSRINGSWDVKSILSVCPFREAESLMILKRLADSKLIAF
jgi:Domain of unknown function (DUF4388)